MSFSKYVNQIRRSTQRSSRLGVDVDMFLFHHQAGTNDDVVINAMVSGSKQVSANYTISNEGRITGVVDEEYRAWTSGSSSDGGKGASYDRRAITVEVENQSASPDWNISDAAFHALARLMQDVAKRHNFPLDRAHVLGHRELWERFRASYPTFCPGPVSRVDRAVNEARAITGGSPVPSVPAGSTDTPSNNVNYGYGLTTEAQKAVQGALARLGRYAGIVDGVFGGLSVRAFQKWLVDNGYLAKGYTVDGVPGPLYGAAVQKLAAKFGYTGPIDGVPGGETSKGIVKWAATIVPPKSGNAPAATAGRDWSYWEPTGELAKRVQRALKARGRYDGPIDGVFGPNTRKGVQKTLAVSGIFNGTIDGVIERGGCYGIQQYARKFGSYSGVIDGAPRTASWTGFALGLERP